MKRYRYSALILGFLCLTGCDSSSSSSTKPPQAQADGNGNGDDDGPIPNAGLGLRGGLTVDRSAFLKNIGNGIAQRTQEFRIASESLSTAAQAYCVNYDATALENLRQQFSAAMLVWQQLELYQMGPLATTTDLKSKIYGWPQLAYYCKIDEESIYAFEDPEYELPTSYANRKGLQALEYLIFDSTLATTCPLTQPAKAQWEAMIDLDRIAARCAYMKPVAAELIANAKVLEKNWGPVDDNVITRGLGNPAAEQASLQQLFDNLFYFDLEVKNQKLAAPAGQDIKFCNKSPFPCPDKEELRYSHLSKQALSANFRALADVTFGFGEPRLGGLSALVRAQGGTKAASRSEKDIATLVAASEKESGTMDTLVNAKATEDCDTSNISWLCQVRNGIRTIIGDFKNEYAAVLKTTVPAAPAGDND